MRHVGIKKLRLLTLILAGLLCGCAGDEKPAPTPKQEAVKQWNDARAMVLLGLARDQFNQGQFDQSRKTVDQAIGLSPDDSFARILSARLYIEVGQLESAQRELDSARKIAPASGEADYLSGVVYQRWAQPQQALEFYQSACDKAPAELSYLMARAEMLVAMNRQVEALTLLQSKSAYFEHSAVIRDEAGLLLMQQGHGVEAVEMLRRAGILAPDDLTIREHLSDVLYQTQHYSECAESVASLLKQDKYAKRPDLMMMLGECQLELGRSADACDNFRAASELMPTLPGVWLSLAKSQLNLNELIAADISLHRDLSMNPNNSETYLLMGYLRLRQSRPSDALAAFRQASQLAPADATSLCMIGYSLEKLGDQQQAITFYGQALKLNPKDEMASQLMAGLDLHE